MTDLDSLEKLAREAKEFGLSSRCNQQEAELLVGLYYDVMAMIAALKARDEEIARLSEALAPAFESLAAHDARVSNPDGRYFSVLNGSHVVAIIEVAKLRALAATSQKDRQS